MNLSDVDNTNYFPLKHSVIVMVVTMDEGLWWPLWYPPKSWSTSAIVLISTSTSCSRKKYLQTPLLDRITSVALLCPYKPQRASHLKVSFRVSTWLPFAAKDQLVELGTWNPEAFKSWNQLFIDRFQDMSRKNMSTIAQTGDKPLIHKTSDGNFAGFNYVILNHLSWWLKFNLKYYGNDTVMRKTMFDTVERGIHDVLINYINVTPERKKMFEFTVPYFREGFGIVVEIPPPLPRWQNIIYPFSWLVWFFTIVSLFSTAIMYHILGYRYEKSFINNTIVVSQSLLSEPVAKVPTSWRLRNFILVWWIVSWYLNMTYTCNLIAVLTIPVFPKKIQTAQELAASSYRLCMLDYGEFVPKALANSKHPTLFALGQVLDMVPFLDTEHVGEEACAEHVLAGTHAHIETDSFIKILYSALDHNSDVYHLQEQLYQGYLVFLITKHAPWKYKFDLGMQWLFEAGLMNKWYQESMEEFIGHFKEEKTIELQPLSLAHLQGPFLMCAGGLFISLLVMVGEVLVPSSNDDDDIIH